MSRLIALALFILGGSIFSVSLVNAQENSSLSAPSVAAVPVQEAVVPAVVEPPVVSAPVSIMSNDGTVTLDFQDADIRNVLKVLAFKSGVNIVVSPEVAGNVSIQLADVPWQKALEVILSTYGYGFERKGNIITVTTIENLKKRREDNKVLEEQEPLMTKTYSLSFSKASDVVDSISKIKSARGTINFDQRTNSVIVRDVQSSIDLMDSVVKTLDAVTPQVLIEAKVVETTLSNSEKLGIDWTIGGTASGSKRPTNFPFERDAVNQQLPGSFGAPASSLFSYGTLDLSAFQAVMQMLNTRTDTNILSNPKIVTLDNQPAKIVVGTQYPMPQYTYNSEQAKLTVSGFSYKDIGIVFEVTPHVNNSNMVTLDLHPTISAINGTVTFDTSTLPQLSVEEASTRVMVENGQTLVIAGLIKDETTITNKKVPFLGDIPLVGQAFKKKDNTKTKTELLIFLTPHIITAQSPQGTANSPAVPAKSGQ